MYLFKLVFSLPLNKYPEMELLDLKKKKKIQEMLPGYFLYPMWYAQHWGFKEEPLSPNACSHQLIVQYWGWTGSNDNQPQ